MKTKDCNRISLSPGDYVVFNGGLKIENVSTDNLIEVNLPSEYTVSKMTITRRTS